MIETPIPYGFRILGDCTGGRRLIDHAAAFRAYAACDTRAEVNREAYLSAFRFGSDFRHHLTTNGTTKGFAGLCGASWLWFDIDREGDIPKAQKDAGRLAVAIVTRYDLAANDLLVFFSGSKGFHIGLPCSPWNPPASAEFHRTARRFGEAIARGVNVTIDTGIYDRVRAFRAPNSRHPKTGLHKRLLSVVDLWQQDTSTLLALAKEPVPFDIPERTADKVNVDRMAEDWAAASVEVQKEIEVKAMWQANGNGPAALNRLTLDFIRNGANEGDRHRLLYSAAANLAEFSCPPTLAHALLTESGRDIGLSPADVHRQIDCGLADGGPKQ